MRESVKKRRRKIRARAVFSLFAVCIIIIAAIWFFVNKLDEQDEIITIKLKTETINLDQGADFNLDQYIDQVTDKNGNELIWSETKNIQGTYWISEQPNTDIPGNYELSVFALTKENQLADKKITVIVNGQKTNNADGTASENENNNGGYDSTIDPNHCEPYYVKGILLVNKRHPLPPSYGDLDPQAAKALEQLQSAASGVGYSIPTLSAYRSYEYQGTLYSDYVERDGQAEADRYSARPGFSEHQSGLAFDVGELDYDYGDTDEGTWLREHCHEYGFIIRYPKDKESITGYLYEPWHIRYVGKEDALKIYQQGVTLEEYLGED